METARINKLIEEIKAKKIADAAKKVIDSLEVISEVYQQQIDAFQEQLFDLNDDEFKQIKDNL